jgi:hypothetical protein
MVSSIFPLSLMTVECLAVSSFSLFSTLKKGGERSQKVGMSGPFSNSISIFRAHW